MLHFRSAVLALAMLACVPPSTFAQALTPDEAIKRMKVPDGFEVKLVASEPMIRQPLTMTFDARGRLWCIQYLQYPNPAGLKPVKVDQFLRTVYDRVPEAPPKGPKGIDRVTILFDPDENGKYRQSKDFLNDLNLATGLALGNDGVYVLQSPYLLFYADKNHDDVPDGDPEVLLSGFGMEDSHSYANSLQWGPDGWLYGAAGSTSTALVRGIGFQQGVWRYHPKTKEFELFSEGGGNTFGLDFDQQGRVIAGTNWGGKAMLHQVQGAYYIKGFGKHGPLHNPHTYGYFDHVPYTNFKGGHVTCGGVMYLADAYPSSFRNTYIAANLLSNDLYWHAMKPDGSTFTAEHGGDFLISNDPWFRPIDCFIGPDGAVNVVDWYDRRAAHLDPVDTWDKTNGRIYKIVAKDKAMKWPTLDLEKETSMGLVAYLHHPNIWYVREARRILGERRDPSVYLALGLVMGGTNDRIALEAFWALYVSGGFNDKPLDKMLSHPNEHIRAWTVRLIGDEKKVTPSQREAFVKLAKTDPSPTVRSQLACTAKRLPGDDALPIVRELLLRTDDIKDPYIPMLCWWVIEDKAITHREKVLTLFDDASFWNAPLVKLVIVERIARRYLAEGKDIDLASCARLLSKAPNNESIATVIRGMDKALEGRRLTKVPAELESPLAELMKKQPSDALLRFAVRLGSPAAYQQLITNVKDAKRTDIDRLAWIDLLSQSGGNDCVPVLLELLASAKTDAMRNGLLTALNSFNDDAITKKVLSLYPTFAAPVKSKAQTLLLARPASALLYLQTIDAGTLPIKEVTLEQARSVVKFKNADVTKIVEKHFGKVGGEVSGEKAARIAFINGITLRNYKGNLANGKALFTKSCATCHQLFGEGTKIGPDLTTADRMNRGYMVQNIVEPSGYIRPEFVAFNVEMNDGRILTGLMVESTPTSITIVDAKNQKLVIAREKIEEMEASPVSLMPEKILDVLSDQEIADLFSYLQSVPPPMPKN